MRQAATARLENAPSPTMKFERGYSHTSPRYVSKPSGVESIPAETILRAIVASLGQPRYALNQDCENTAIVVLYGEAAYPRKSTYYPPLGYGGGLGTAQRVPIVKSEQCESDRRFLRITIFAGHYSVDNKEMCARGRL